MNGFCMGSNVSHIYLSRQKCNAQTPSMLFRRYMLIYFDDDLKGSSILSCTTVFATSPPLWSAIAPTMARRA